MASAGRRWLARHPRFVLHFIPTSSSWLNLIERCFAEQAKSEAWASKLKEIFPARESVLEDNAELYREVSAESAKRLLLNA